MERKSGSLVQDGPEVLENQPFNALVAPQDATFVPSIEQVPDMLDAERERIDAALARMEAAHAEADRGPSKFTSLIDSWETRLASRRSAEPQRKGVEPKGAGNARHAAEHRSLASMQRDHNGNWRFVRLENQAEQQQSRQPWIERRREQIGGRLGTCATGLATVTSVALLATSSGVHGQAPIEFKQHEVPPAPVAAAPEQGSAFQKLVFETTNPIDQKVELTADITQLPKIVDHTIKRVEEAEKAKAAAAKKTMEEKAFQLANANPFPEGSLYHALHEGGFRGDKVIKMGRIAMAESKANAWARYRPGTGENSFCFLQINMDPKYAVGRRKNLKISKDEQLLDPETCARAGHEISEGGENLSPWTTHQKGDDKKFANYGNVQLQFIKPGNTVPLPKRVPTYKTQPLASAPN